MLIRVADLETTGFAPPEAGVCEIAWNDVEPLKVNLAGDPCGWALTVRDGTLVNPGHPIPPITSAVHHLIDEDVAAAAPWGEAFKAMMDIHHVIPDVWCAHNAKFERQWITDELTGGRPWICTYKCALRLFPEAPAHSNQALRYFLKPPGLDRQLANLAHRAGPDAYVTAHLLIVMLERATVEQMIEWSSQPAILPRITFGKLRGQPWSAADDGLLRWCLDKDFDEDVLFTARHHLEERRKQREAEWKARQPAQASMVSDDDEVPF